MDSNNTIAQLREVNTPVIKTGSIAIESNNNRGAWSIQNLSTDKLYVRLGGQASVDLFHFILKGGSSQDDGNGGVISQAEGAIYAGIVTVYGNNKRYVIMEI